MTRRATIHKVVHKEGKMPMAEAYFTDDKDEQPIRFPVSSSQKEESNGTE